MHAGGLRTVSTGLGSSTKFVNSGLLLADVREPSRANQSANTPHRAHLLLESVNHRLVTLEEGPFTCSSQATLNASLYPSYAAPQVFRPDIPLPTMSLAEFADLEMAEMERQQRAQAEAEFERAKVISQCAGAHAQCRCASSYWACAS